MERREEQTPLGSHNSKAVDAAAVGHAGTQPCLVPAFTVQDTEAQRRTIN